MSTVIYIYMIYIYIYIILYIYVYLHVSLSLPLLFLLQLYMKQQLRVIFALLDGSDDGDISVNELRPWNVLLVLCVSQWSLVKSTGTEVQMLPSIRYVQAYLHRHIHMCTVDTHMYTCMCAYIGRETFIPA